VTVAPVKKVVGPDDEVEVEVTTVDQLGRPVAAELSLALVDRSLLRLYRDSLPSIGAFFYNQTRTGAFATHATNTFKYEPGTTGVSEAVVEDAERAAALAANQAGRPEVLKEAKDQVALGLAPAKSEPAAPASEAARPKRALGEMDAYHRA